jgi:hypothetical protein
MSLLSLIVTLVVVGVVMWLINTYLPLEPGIRKLLNAVVILLVVLWLLSAFGLMGSLSQIRWGE